MRRFLFYALWFSIKKLDRVGERPPPRHYIKKRPSWPRPRNPPNPGSWSWVWCHVPGTVTQRAGTKLTTQPPGSGATFLGPLPTGPGPGWLHSPSHQEHSEGGFFPQAGEIRPGGGSNPPPAGAAGCAQTNWANNLRSYGFPFIYSQHISMPYSSLCSLICLKHWVVLAHCYSPSFSSFCLFWAAGMWLDYNIRWLYTFKHHIVWPQHAPQLGFSSP